MTIFSIIFLILVIITLVSGILMKYNKLYKEDEEVADLITNELIEICDKNIQDSEEFKEEISAIFEEIKNIIEL